MALVHNRKLVLGGVALTMARIPARKDAAAANKARDEYEKIIIETGFLDDAPFRWIGLIIRYGLVDDDRPKYKIIDRRDGELPLSIEIDVERLMDKSEQEMVEVYRQTITRVLIDVGRRFKLTTDQFE